MGNVDGWNVMDKDTRCLLSSNIMEKREIDNTQKIFCPAEEVAKEQKSGKTITYSLHAYKDTFN